MTTFDNFFEEYPEQKEIYDKEYKDFLLSEFELENRENQNAFSIISWKTAISSSEKP